MPSSTAELIQYLVDNRHIRSSAVREAMAAVDRQYFAANANSFNKINPYDDTAVPIGYNACVNSPHYVATCLELFQEHVGPGKRVLDVGSGSGYSSCILAIMVGNAGKVVAIDYVPTLVEWAKENCREACPTIRQPEQLEFLVRDGWEGYEEGGKYDAIHVGAATAEVPKKLAMQLKPGGRMVFPYGREGERQALYIVDMDDDGSFSFYDAGLTAIRCQALETGPPPAADNDRKKEK